MSTITTIRTRAVALARRFALVAAAVAALAPATLLAPAAFGPIGAHAEAPAAPQGSQFQICSRSTYALCAVASCFVLNGVSYCRCSVEHGTSITATLPYDGGDACTANAEGRGNGYMLSTFSFPKEALKGGTKALYSCPPAQSTGAYAQCDGGICFRSTQGQSFPGFDQPLKKDEIICSCPIVTADPASAKVGYQIVGPYPCQKSFLKNCTASATSDANGATVFVGSPTGGPRALTKGLYGSVPEFNHCF